MFTPSFTPGNKQILLARKSQGQNRGSSSLGDKVHFWGPTSPLGSYFAPRGVIKNLALFPTFSATPTSYSYFEKKTRTLPFYAYSVFRRNMSINVCATTSLSRWYWFRKFMI
jgi:hypothetical protein